MTEPTWQKSTYSEQGSACVEIATTPTSPRLTLRPITWADFVSYVSDTRPPG